MPNRVPLRRAAERMRALLSNEAEELLPSLLLSPEYAQHAARRRCGARLLHTTHSHAHVLALYNDGDALRSQSLIEGQRDLLRQALLNLQTS